FSFIFLHFPHFSSFPSFSIHFPHFPHFSLHFSLQIQMLESELEYMRQRALADAETIALLEQKNALLSQLLEGESLEKGSMEEGRAKFTFFPLYFFFILIFL